MKTTKNTYHLKTKANFEFLKYGNEAKNLYETLVKEFGEHFHSTSGSRYVVDDNNILYRFSNHWGNVASCVWNLKNAPEHLFKSWNIWKKEMILAKVNLNNIVDTRTPIEYFKFNGINKKNGRRSVYYFECSKKTKEDILKDFQLESDIKIIINFE